MFRFHPIDTFDVLEELRTGHRNPSPRDPMKMIFLAVLGAIIGICIFGLTSCITETTRTITTDKAGTVTDVTTTRKGTDPAALKLVEIAAEIYRPRPAVIVREEKADHDMRRLLRGWQGRAAVAAAGPITAEEITRRWQPQPR